MSLLDLFRRKPAAPMSDASADYAEPAPVFGADNMLVFLGGSERISFRCRCGANVFKKAIAQIHDTYLYKCNACGTVYEGDSDGLGEKD
mgnify:CR=1 FL=1